MPQSASAVSYAAHGPNLNSTKTMSKSTSIYTAKAHRISIAVQRVTQTKTTIPCTLSIVAALLLGKPNKNIALSNLNKALMYSCSKINDNGLLRFCAPWNVGQ